MSEVDFNVNEIVGHAAADLVESFFSTVGSCTKDQIAKYKIRFGKGFSKYLLESFARYSQYKTLINRYNTISLKDNYVPTQISYSNCVVRDDDIFDLLVKKRRIIIEGTAGLGKTLLVRRMFTHTILNEKNFIPILFELRNLHFDNTQSLVSNLVKQVSAYISGFSEEHFIFGMRSGKFIIFLDGIDEISLEDRSRYASEILDLTYRYTETPILLSTRPDDFYVPWEVFGVGKLLPMTRNQTVLMLEKLQFDSEIKEKFIANITEKYFASHSEFLSVPLLATLMMLTFSEFSAVPRQMHVFYEQAFQTLFHKHDFIKGAFSRKIESGLDVEQFRRVLSAFCFISYLEQRFSFLQYQAIEDIRASIKLSNFECDTEYFLKDLLVSVCLLQRDGNYITFVHRTFQEYFAALFVIKSPPLDIFNIIEELVSRGSVDNVLGMALQLNDGLIEQEWVLPKLKYMDDIAINEYENDFDLIKSVFGTPYFRFGLVKEFNGKIDWNSMIFIVNEYSDLKYGTSDNAEGISDSGRISKYIDQQQSLADKDEPHNEAALKAHEREFTGRGINLSVLPVDLVSGLKCIREAGGLLRELSKIRTKLDVKQQQRSKGIRALLSQYKK